MPLRTISAYFAELPDPRRPSLTSHRLVDSEGTLLSAPLSAFPFGEVVRPHAQIDNRVHGVFDIAFREDAARMLCP